MQDMDDLAAVLGSYRVGPGTVAIVWLEQSHFVFKTSSGLLVHVDPFLSRTVKPEKHLRARPFLEPDQAAADVVFLTHDHRDHTDPDTLVPMARRSPGCRFVGPAESCERLRALGIEAARITPIAEGASMSFAGFSATAVYAENTSEHDRTTHLGFVFDFDGIAIYHVGDTRRDPDSYLDRLHRVRDLAPRVLIVPINEGYNNPGIAGAVRLAQIVRPRYVVPCHYDCFVANTADPAAFERALPPEPGRAVRRLGHGELWRLERAG
jgi:L-ascorbate metabolism protein UlaG (beta-lactamase superfamily)